MDRPKFTLPHSLDGDTFGWGPTSAPDTLQFCLGDMAMYPFDPATKQDRLGRVCDFTYSTMQRHQRDGRAVAAVVEDEADFQLVDSRPVKVNRFQNNRFARRPQQPRRDMNQRQPQNQQMQHQPQNNMRGPQSAQSQRQYQQQQQQRQQQWQRNNRQRLLAEWSIEPQQDWTNVDTRQLAALSNLSLDSSKITFQDIEWRGELRMYRKVCDKILPKSSVLLSDEFTKTTAFYWPGTADDSIIVNAFDNDPSITIAATDQILACLMAATQSRISWHLIFTKANGRMFIDKQNGTTVDSLSVDETHKEPPLSDHPIKMNRPADLATEARKINQNFSQQVLDRTSSPALSFPAAPFVDTAEDTPATKLYRYRIVTLPGYPQGQTDFQKQPLKILVRAEIDAMLPNATVGADESYVNIHAFNEYCPSRSLKPWRAQIEHQIGALIAQESKNNHCKVGKWVCKAMIAGVQNLKIGFITRNSPDNNERHSVLNIQSFKIKDLGTQIGLKNENAWAIVRALVDLVMTQPDGRYILVKDPVKPEIKLFRTAEEDDEDSQVNEAS